LAKYFFRFLFVSILRFLAFILHIFV
jgi:hypothetical protein